MSAPPRHQRDVDGERRLDGAAHREVLARVGLDLEPEPNHGRDLRLEAVDEPHALASLPPGLAEPADRASRGDDRWSSRWGQAGAARGRCPPSSGAPARSAACGARSRRAARPSAASSASSKISTSARQSTRSCSTCSSVDQRVCARHSVMKSAGITLRPRWSCSRGRATARRGPRRARSSEARANELGLGPIDELGEVAGELGVSGALRAGSRVAG